MARAGAGSRRRLASIPRSARSTFRDRASAPGPGTGTAVHPAVRRACTQKRGNCGDSLLPPGSNTASVRSRNQENAHFASRPGHAAGVSSQREYPAPVSEKPARDTNGGLLEMEAIYRPGFRRRQPVTTQRRKKRPVWFRVRCVSPFEGADMTFRQEADCHPGTDGPCRKQHHISREIRAAGQVRRHSRHEGSCGRSTDSRPPATPIRVEFRIRFNSP